MSKRKLLTLKKDAEEIFNILYSDRDSSAIAEEIEEAEELQIVLQPPIDGEDSDKDDAPSDGEEASANIKDIGRGVLSQAAEVRVVSRDGKKHLDVDSIIPAEPSCSAKRQCKKPKKARKWLPKELKNSSSALKWEEDNEEPTVVKKIREEDLKPVDMFKLCYESHLQ